MPKVKVPRKSTLIDMTAMCDVAFLLLTFFMLTTQFKADEALVVDTPSSISEIKLPDSDIMAITINKKGEIFFSIDGQEKRIRLLEKMGTDYGITFNDEQKKKFSLLPGIGVPVTQLTNFLNLEVEEAKKPEYSTGIPVDTTLQLTNELARWIINARLTNPRYRVVLRGDNQTEYGKVKAIIATLTARQINKFNLVTDLEQKPKI